tara:strand:+ start:687 stop:1550 length:864 start_codon:yes stop_codon:yes gene_type:complete
MKPLYTQHTTLSDKYICERFEFFLAEDRALHDLSTQFSINQNAFVQAHLVAEETLIFVGTPILNAIFNNQRVELKINDGETCNAGDIIATITGPASLLLSYERILLNLIQRLSGIAFLTSKYVQALSSSKIKILDTRKTTPGIRLFEKYAVNVGGGYNHRLDLFDGIMLKDNHLSMSPNVSEVICNIKKQYPDKHIQIEIDYFAQLEKYIKNNLPIDAVLLDNMSRADTIKSVEYINKTIPQCFIESSGGINLNNISNYIGTGIHAISIGALTHQAASKNIKLEFDV